MREQTQGIVSRNSFLRRFLNGEKSILMNRTEEELAEGGHPTENTGQGNKLSASLMAPPTSMGSGDRVDLSAKLYLKRLGDESDFETVGRESHIRFPSPSRIRIHIHFCTAGNQGTAKSGGATQAGRAQNTGNCGTCLP